MKVATALADKITERRLALEADKAEEQFFVYILVPYFPNAARSGTDLRVAAARADLLLRSSDFLDGTFPGGPSLVGRVLNELEAPEKTPDRIELIDMWGYLQTRWHDLLSSVDPAGESWAMHCLRLPPYKRARREDDWLSDELVYEDTSVDDRRMYIHSKVTIVDDVWATIGSANINVRSYTSDSEINCNYIGGGTDERGLRVSVRDLRRQLWAEHLGMALGNIPLQAGNDPDVIGFWQKHTVPAASVPESAPGTRPVGSRVYPWLYREIQVGKGDPPTISWSRLGAPVTVEPYGIEEIPMYWWATEGYGKAPWPPEGPNDELEPDDVEDLMPPPIGSDRFGFDLHDGAQYTGYDLFPHPPERE